MSELRTIAQYSRGTPNRLMFGVTTLVSRMIWDFVAPGMSSAASAIALLKAPVGMWINAGSPSSRFW